MRKLLLLLIVSVQCFAQLPPCAQTTGGVLSQACLNTMNSNFPQAATQAGQGYTSGPKNPSACRPGTTLDNFNTSTTPGLWYYCSASNTWSQGRSVLGNLLVGNRVSATNIPLPATAYDFTAIAPGGSLTGGTAATVTLTPGPAGVSASDVTETLYISGGTGTYEWVNLNGTGTCTGVVSASCTVNITPANSHSGAWTVQSATAGTHEAYASCGTSAGCVVHIAGSPTWYGPMFWNQNFRALFYGDGSYDLTDNVGSYIYFNPPAPTADNASICGGAGACFAFDSYSNSYDYINNQLLRDLGIRLGSNAGGGIRRSRTTVAGGSLVEVGAWQFQNVEVQAAGAVANQVGFMITGFGGGCQFINTWVHEVETPLVLDRSTCSFFAPRWDSSGYGPIFTQRPADFSHSVLCGYSSFASCGSAPGGGGGPVQIYGPQVYGPGYASADGISVDIQDVNIHGAIYEDTSGVVAANFIHLMAGSARFREYGGFFSVVSKPTNLMTWDAGYQDAKFYGTTLTVSTSSISTSLPGGEGPAVCEGCSSVLATMFTALGPGYATVAPNDQTQVGSLTTSASATTNIVNNPSFETNLIGWDYTQNGTFTQSATIGYSGAYSMKAVASASGAMVTGQGSSGTYLTVSPSTVYTYSLYAYSPTGGQVEMFHCDFTSNYSATCEVTNGGVTIPAATWTRLSTTFTTTSATAYISLRPHYTASGAGDTVYWDAIQLEAGRVATAYLDGSMGAGFAWSGTANASASIRKSGVVTSGVPISSAQAISSATGFDAQGAVGFTGVKTAGSCTFTIVGGIITGVSGC